MDPLGKIRSWLCTWEIYPILFVAAFLRFYQINTSEFDADQALVFRMAHDAIYHGLLPATSNIASIRIVNPPAVIYLLMLPAAFSANPLWGILFVGLFNVIAVLLTYIFVRRYYGRLAAIIASLLYATAAEPVYFSRFIWQQNLIAPFVVLFIFALFWGVVERRRGWLFPALLLLGILIQLHETTIILCVPLLVALLLAPGTVRWRDLTLGIASLLLIFFPYLLWEFSTKFSDLHTILQVSTLHARFDNQALFYYGLFLSPYDHIPTNTHSLLYSLIPFLGWVLPVMLLLVICALALAFIEAVLLPRRGGSGEDEGRGRLRRLGLEAPSPSANGLQSLHIIWTEFRSAPQRCGFFLLLVWQIVPILFLSRHAVPLFPYYLLLLMPGPFILIGLFLSTVARWLQRRGRQWHILHYGVYALACFLTIAQLLGSMAAITDQASGNIPHSYAFNTLNSLQDALVEADQLALRRHLNHVYIATDQFTEVSLRYLAEQMQTPTTLFDASHCLVLPNPAAGPAVLLVGPYDQLTGVLLGQFAIATLIDHPKRLGGVPFQLYIVQPIAPSKLTSSNEGFVNNLQLLDNRAQPLNFNSSTWLTSRWSFTRSASPNYRTTYTYAMKALLNDSGNAGLSVSSQCISTSMRAGDQLIVTFELPKGTSVPPSVSISATTYTTMPLHVSYGPIHLENVRDQSTPLAALQTTTGTASITLPAS
jgi:4-amino-4-deoxy-L-arabinose transferase-like glycosyltransferase